MLHIINKKKETEIFELEKLTERIREAASGLSKEIEPEKVAQKTMEGLFENINTAGIEELSIEVAASMLTEHPDYSFLASRIAIDGLHQRTEPKFSITMKKLYQFYNSKLSKHQPLIAKETWESIEKHQECIDNAIDYGRDYRFDYFGFKTLEKSYLLRINGQIAERPQDMYMRVAIGIYPTEIEQAIKIYNLLSEHYFTFATPTLFNAGTPKPQMSSCFLLSMKQDSIPGIYETLQKTAIISQHAGGIGLSIHNIRARGSYISGTNGQSNGIIPMLRVFNSTARYVDQGGGKRKGAFAIYLEPWHADIFEFLDLRKNHGKEELRARDLFYALWIPDLFMQRVESNEEWSLFSPDEAPGLDELWGDAFNNLYLKYEQEKRYRQKIKARSLWIKIMESQIETGNPFMVYKDAANRKSNQQNRGTIKSSNLCTEIIEYTDPDEIAVCNLASISLPRFIKKDQFSLSELYRITYEVTISLNRIIDKNFYPLKEARRSNLANRPIGIGVQGLADVFQMLGYPFGSPESRKLNREIFETIYFSAMTASKDLSVKYGPYQYYEGSPASKGLFQFDLWGITPQKLWDWDNLKKEVKKFGIRNSLLVAPMPTASTSQILGNNECFEPFTSNLYTRRTLSGEFVVINKHLMKVLIEKKLWNKSTKEAIIKNNGSIQNIKGLDSNLKEIFKTVWEIKQKDLIDMAADRGPFICQSQSLNLFLKTPTISQLTSMHFYSWKKGLKTGMYYLRTQSAAQPFQFTVSREPDIKNQTSESCSMQEGCESCGS